jgi:hypothetical protein
MPLNDEHVPGDTPAELSAELGYPRPEPEKGEHLPPAGGRLTLPHFATFSQIVNLVSRTYRYTFDEALRSSGTNALAIRRDPVILDALRSRQMPTAQLPWHLEARDDTDTRQVEAVKVLTDVINEIPRFQHLKMSLLEAIWYGRYGAQIVYGWDFTDRKRLCVMDHKPLNGDKLVFKYGGDVGVLVHATYSGSWQVTDRGRAHFFTPQEREAVVVHQHEPEDADFAEGDMAGAIHGVGIRSRLYWFWWLRTQVVAFLMDYLERVGAGGFTIYYFEAGNNASMQEVKEAAESQWRNNAILFPRYRDNPNAGPGIQRIEPSQAGAQLLQSLITTYFDEVIRRFILGQTLSSHADATGLGSGVADLHSTTLSRIIKYDAVNLQETLTEQLVKVLCRYNCPGVPHPKFVFDVDKPNAGELLEAATAYYQMGGTIDGDELRGIIGLSKPAPGNAILSKLGAPSPAAIGAVPEGVPMLGQPGPEAQPGGSDFLPEEGPPGEAPPGPLPVEQDQPLF